MRTTTMSYPKTIRQLVSILTGFVLLFVLATCDESRLVNPDDNLPQPSEWNWQNPLPQGNTLRAVSLTDSKTATAVGDHGTIMRTTDGGATWVSQTSGTTNELNGVTFNDANIGTTVGEFGTILRTNDGGGM